MLLSLPSATVIFLEWWGWACSRGKELAVWTATVYGKEDKEQLGTWIPTIEFLASPNDDVNIDPATKICLGTKLILLENFN